MDQDKINLQVTCRHCGTTHNIRVGLDDLHAWQRGEKMVQDAFPYLSADKREILISRICPRCWDELFSQYD